MANVFLLSKKDTMLVFGYSLIFLGTVVPKIALLCILAILPFTGGAWIGGMFAVSQFHSNSAYLPDGWLAVFMQAYVVTYIYQATKRRSKKNVV